MPNLLLEHAAKMLGVFKAKLIRDFAYRFVRVEDFLLGHIDKFGLDVFLGGFSGLFFDQVTKIIAGQMQLVGKVPHRGQSVF